MGGVSSAAGRPGSCKKHSIGVVAPPVVEAGRERVHLGATVLAMALGAAIRGGFALAFPTIHGGDAAARLAHADQLILGYQLPFPQVFVMLGKALSDDPVLVRLIFCLWGGFAVAGLTALVSRCAGPQAAVFAGLLLASDPLLIHYSIVPYQEPVAYGLLAWAFFLGALKRPIPGACLMALACLSRFETWLFLPCFFWLTRSQRATALAATPVVGWLFCWGGLAPSGLYVLDIDLAAQRVPRFVYLFRKLLDYETWVLPIGATLSFVALAFRRDRLILKAVGCVSAAIVVVIVLGHEYPAGSGLMSERLIHLPVLLLLGLASIGLGRLSSVSRGAFAVSLIVTLLFAGRSIRFETALLRTAANDPDLALARDVATAIALERVSGECVRVDAPTVDKALLDAYVAKVRAAFGDVGRAQERAAELAATSPDRDRIAAHLRAPVGTVSPRLDCALIVTIDGPSQPHGKDTDGNSKLIANIIAGQRTARIARIP
jgi:hypothetical protein